MKSSNDGLDIVMKRYFRMIYRPTDVVEELASTPVNLMNTFIIVAVSALLLVAGIFIAGDALYTMFHDYAYSYPLEIVTSGQIFGYYLPFDYSVLVFITDIIFCIKAWVFLSILLFIFLRIFKYQISIKRVAQIIGWSIFPFGIIMFATSLVCLGLKYILPLIFHFIYFGVLAAVFIGIAPIIVYIFLQRFNVSVYNAFRSYYLSLFIVFIIWTFNHADKVLSLVW
ncbi:MAG: hypothetical protein ACTSYB_12385 [Candidatus Helarchaeota archaeon]